MTIPEGFELEPVKAGSHPAPDAPVQQKADIYDDAEIHFKTTDERAIDVCVIYCSLLQGFGNWGLGQMTPINLHGGSNMVF